MNKKTNETGFTLIELLLVVVIIGILLAVIVPRAWRANVDAKYSLVRQNATELASFASQWAEQMMEASNSNSTATLTDYYNTLASHDDAASANAAWVAIENASSDNWTDTVEVTGRRMGDSEDDAEVEASVEDIVPPERLPRNPFNGASVFVITNNPFEETLVIPGALACGMQPDSDDNFNYYAFVFQGTDSETHGISVDTTFHAGQSANTLSGLRNGIFMARLAAN